MSFDEQTPILEARELTKTYDDGQIAVNEVSFSIGPGQIYAVLGGNGAGKTTTINLFLNLIEPTRGEARIQGIVTHKEPLRAKQHVAFVSENVMLYGNFTALENLDYFTRLGGRRECTHDEYRHTLLRVGLAEDAHHRKIREFSKGMRQKCGIAIAILKGAPAILLDEPTSGLDPVAGYEFLELLKSLRRERRAILMSTHDIFRAREVADKMAIMERGRLVREVTSDQFCNCNMEEFYRKYLAGHNGGNGGNGGNGHNGN